MPRLLVILTIVTSLLIPFQSASAQTQIEFSDLAAFYKFADQITFQAKVQSVNLIQDLHLIIQPEGQARFQEKITLNPQGEIIFTFNLKSNPIQPFALVTYWFSAATLAGGMVESIHENFRYEENFSEWTRLEEDRFIVSWHTGDIAFGQAALNTAKAGLRSVNAYLPLVAPPSIRIYIYTTARELQSALLEDQATWKSGHTSPNLKVILVSILPGANQQAEMERQIPHEIAHIIIYQIAGSSNYINLPTWLSEGLASQAEFTPNSDYARAMERAAQTGQLLSLESLCATFPTSASSAFLAYAQSTSFVRFYFQQFGSVGLINLISQYQVPGCVEGVQSASSFSLAQLQARWQQSAFGLTDTTLAYQTLAPYFLLGLLLLLIPLGMSIALHFHRRSP